MPLVIHNRHLFPQYQSEHVLTNHVDLLPTMLGLANVDSTAINSRLQNSFSEARPLVGRDLTPVIREQNQGEIAEQPVYFMTDDDITRGQRQINILGEPYPSVIQPNHIEMVIATLQTGGAKELWKFTRYFDSTQFWSQPGVKDVTMRPVSGYTNGQHALWAAQVKTQPACDEYELYNLTTDPLETCNLAHPAFATQQGRSVQQQMMHLLEGQRKQKRLYPAQSVMC